MSKRLNITPVTPLFKGLDVLIKVGLLLGHRSNLDRNPFCTTNDSLGTSWS